MGSAIDNRPRARFTQRVSPFGRTRTSWGIYVVAKLRRGDLGALDRAYSPMGFFVGDEKTPWEEFLSDREI